MIMTTHKGVFALWTPICISSPGIDEDVVSRLYEMSKSLIKIHTEIVCTCTQNIHMHASTYPLTCTSVLMSFSSGEDKSKGASPSSQKNQLLLHELLRCLPSVSLQKKKSHCSVFPPPAHSLLLPSDIMTYRHKFSRIKVFILLMTYISQYSNTFSPALAVFVHTHPCHI